MKPAVPSDREPFGAVPFVEREPNTIEDIGVFLRSWNNPAATRRPAILRRSEVGNINRYGLSGVWAADDLDPMHPQWREGIEEAVWPVVNYITATLELVTYDSCGGHPHCGPVEARPLHVGILPATTAECQPLGAMMSKATSYWDAWTNEIARITVSWSVLVCAASGSRCAVLDITAIPLDGVFSAEYFTARPMIAAQIINGLDSGRRLHGTEGVEV
ncbi:hypothetical protein ACIA8C_22870 [Nocardia sp. NPDC051321]|uniref:hypothetical protein n=1 Tax=Nocardia sp. NPDC051321 TaxID=3364323 RepID=UPI0037B86833